MAAVNGTRAPDQSTEEYILIVGPQLIPQEVIDDIVRRMPVPTKIFSYVAWTPDALPAEAEQHMAKATIFGAFRFIPERQKIPNVKYVHLFSAGIDHLLDSPYFDPSSPIPISNSNGVHSGPIGEWFALAVLSHLRSWEWMRSYQAAQSWTPDYSFLGRSNDLNGLRMGVFGYGSIGRQIARVGSAFGTKVLAFTSTPRDSPEARRDHMWIVPGAGGDPDGSIPTQWFHGKDREAVHHFLRQDLDILVVACPVTPATRGLFGAAEFDVLAETQRKRGKGTFFVNVARGDVLKQDALVDALNKEHGLRGAALDVASPEPLPSDSPLWTAKNCLLTPHISPLTEALPARVMDIMVHNVKQLRAGEKLVNIVNRGRGY